MLYLGQFVAAVVLPTWVLISRGILADGIGWEFLVYLFACPLLFITMVAVSGLIAARGSARINKAVSWWDAAGLTLWYLAIIAYGFWAQPAIAVSIVVLAIAMLWLGFWQLFSETRARFRGFVAEFEQVSRPGGATPPQPQEPRVIVIRSDQDRDDPPTVR